MAGLPNANPDATGRPSPVMIQMYELRSDLLFKQAEMLPLFSDPVGALGADLVAYDEMTILPGQAYVLEYEPTPETKFVGVMASFRQSAAKGPWKVIVPINPEGQSKIGLELNSASLVLIPPDKVKKWDPAETVANYRETSRTLAPSANAPVTPTYPNDQAPLSPGQVESASENLLEVNPSRVFEYPPEPEALPLPESPQTTKTLKKAKTVSEQ
jgi:type VI secretion system VasD/TssJ family lipoprotein